MNFPTVSSNLMAFFRTHDLDPTLYSVTIATHSPLALDQLRLALSTDYKHLFVTDTYPRNRFVGHFTVPEAPAVRFLTCLEPRPWESRNQLLFGQNS